MTKRMLIDAAHPEETRVVIVDANRVEELDFESRHKRQLRGNVYLARVTRVEPSLQAAFIEYGGNRHGFLAFSEIHPDYYKIPEADKAALKAQEEEDQRLAEEEEEKRKAASAKRKSRTKSDEEEDEFDEDDDHEDDESDDESDQADEDERDENLDPDDDDATDENDAEVADDQAKVAAKRRKRISRRRYKIQEVIKRGQILLVQAVKEERGNKGAAMTTYLSLAGRYCVLMPNTPRGGGISRKISNSSDRKRLKTIMNDLEVPQGMGVIVRTAGAKHTKAEIKRDYEYLSRLWSEIRDTTMQSSAPALIHEEGNLVKRSIRDLYNKEIEEVLVQGDEAYKTAKAFIKMLMPSHAKFVKHYTDELPLFLRYGAEKQIENSLDATVQLKSGGYLVIHPTEALISVDVNSGRSTKERNIERTALKTNLEAAEELARQMRLRDLAGLIVVDFIDMDENKNNRAVERKMKEVLSRDRARIQTSRISQFGLMEISRQRRRRSLLEGSTTSCPHCGGVGRKRTIESSALAAIRAVEEYAVRGKAKRIRLKTSQDVALYLLNEKRDLLTQVDQVTDVFTEVVGEDDFIRPHFELETVEKRSDKRKDPLVKIEQDFMKEIEESEKKAKSQSKAKTKDEETSNDDDSSEPDTDSDDDNTQNQRSSRRRSRRGRRGGRGRSRRDDNRSSDEEKSGSDDALEVINPEGETASEEKPKRRRKSSSRTDNSKKEEDKESSEEKPKSSRRRRRAAPKKADESKTNSETDRQSDDIKDSDDDKTEDKPKRRSSSRRKAPSRKSDEPSETKTESTPKRKRRAPAKSGSDDTTVTETDADSRPKRTRKAPGKTKAETVEETVEAKPKRSRKSSSASKTKAAEKTETSEDAPKRNRKAPAKSSESETDKPTRKRRAPAKPASETVKAEADNEDKPKRRRKAPSKAAKPAAAPDKPTAKVEAEAKPVSEETVEKTASSKKKRGWWSRRKS